MKQGQTQKQVAAAARDVTIRTSRMTADTWPGISFAVSELKQKSSILSRASKQLYLMHRSQYIFLSHQPFQ
jgi:hypothetical protein